MTIYVLDCGIGNVGAVRSMFRHIGAKVDLIDAPRSLENTDSIVLPGVGTFDVGARALEEHGFVDFIRDAVANQHLLLGICLGMQLLCRSSEEGNLSGLGLIPADVIRLESGKERIRIPHMGWNIVEPVKENPLLPMGGEQQRFYFTHSYHACCDSEDDVWGSTAYGTAFPTVIGSANVMGVQFHPEKSHRFGKELLRRFASLAVADA